MPNQIEEKLLRIGRRKVVSQRISSANPTHLIQAYFQAKESANGIATNQTIELAELDEAASYFKVIAVFKPKKTTDEDKSV